MFQKKNSLLTYEIMKAGFENIVFVDVLVSEQLD
jgi:hypothetical protein